VSSAAASLARRARRGLLARRSAEAAAAAAGAALAVGLSARLEGWAAPGPAAAAAAAALAMLGAFWAAARGRGGAAALSPESDADALLRSALSSTAGAEWRELLARSAAGRRPRHEPVAEWIPAALLAAAALFALAWQDSRPGYAPPAAAGAAAAPGAAPPAASARPPLADAGNEALRDGGSAGAQGEWRPLDPAAAEGSILLPPGAAARERGAIERYLRHRAEAAE